MAESVQTTYEEASRCPKCSKPGNTRRKARASGRGIRPGTEIHHIYCENELCPWYNTCWMVQVNPDGSVPPPTNHTNQPKTYAGFEYHDAQAKELLAALEAQRQAEIASPDDPRHEIRNPLSGR